MFLLREKVRFGVSSRDEVRFGVSLPRGGTFSGFFCAKGCGLVFLSREEVCFCIFCEGRGVFWCFLEARRCVSVFLSREQVRFRVFNLGPPPGAGYTGDAADAGGRSPDANADSV